ncbi:hypothetical protein TNCV_500681 [Trichonephila clavipes]|nr:hypothetical protein TNCV_500681 [Trichonephila clavipes]
MIWVVALKFSIGPILTLKGKISGEKYREILAYQIHSMKRTLFPAEDGLFKNDTVPIYATGLVQSSFDELDPHSHPTSI